MASRYRLGEQGKWVLDPLLYLEYKGIPDFSKNGLEFKLIAAKDFGRTEIALNPIVEFEHEERWEFEPGYALGMCYTLGQLLKIGLELKGSEETHYVGPVLSHGTEDLWVALGSAFAWTGVQEEGHEFQVRMLLGIGLDKRSKEE